jgi:hypothetical protein
MDVSMVIIVDIAVAAEPFVFKRLVVNMDAIVTSGDCSTVVLIFEATAHDRLENSACIRAL